MLKRFTELFMLFYDLIRPIESFLNLHAHSQAFFYRLLLRNLIQAPVASDWSWHNAPFSLSAPL